jgi:hypothetical protein
LSFDGTGASASVTKSIPAIFTIAATVNPQTLGTNGRVIANNGSTFEFGIYQDGRPYIFNGTTVRFGTSVVVAGVSSHVAYTLSGTTGTFYVNGVAAGTVTDSNTYGALNFIGGNNATSGMLGTISNFLLENRALSAAEVLALYQSSAVAANDICSAGTALVPATFASGWSTNAGSPTIATTATLPDASSIKVTGFLTVGSRRYRIIVTVNSLSAGSVEYYGLAGWTQFATAPGTYTIDYVAPASASAAFQATGGTAVLSSPQFYALGALIAPEPQALGSGLVWRDISGNAANITLPASGVSWALPWSGTLGFASGTNAAPTVTFGADTNTGLYLDATNVLGVATNGSGTVLFSSSAGVGKIKAHGTRVLALEAGTGNTNITLTPSGTGNILTTGNLLIGTTTDAGQKLQVNGAATFAGAVTVNGTGPSSFSGPLVSSYVYSSALASVKRTALNGAGAAGVFNVGSDAKTINDGVLIALVGKNSADAEQAYGIIASTFTNVTSGSAAGTIELRPYNAGTSVLAATFSGTGTTFGGTVSPQQAATASAPSYVKGAIYFDTTLNKLRVGGATAWETITSI